PDVLRNPGADASAPRKGDDARRGAPGPPGGAGAQGARCTRRPRLPDADAHDGRRCHPRGPSSLLRRRGGRSGAGGGHRQCRGDGPAVPRGGRPGDPAACDKLTRGAVWRCRVDPLGTAASPRAGARQLAPPLLSLGRMPTPLRAGLVLLVLSSPALAQTQSLSLGFAGGGTNLTQIPFNQGSCNAND